MPIPILVVSCDQYSDVWEPFFTCFHKYWPDCPFPISLVSNFERYDDPRVHSILTGEEVDYSSNLIKALDQIESDWLIFWVDDRPPKQKVNTSKLLNYIRLAQNKDAGYFKLLPYNCPPALDGNEPIGQVPKGIPFRVSMTVALWKKSTLLKILEPGESIWDIERRGGFQKSNTINDTFYALAISERKHPPLLDAHLVYRGKLLRPSISFLNENDVGKSLLNRKRTNILREIGIDVGFLVRDIYYRALIFLKKIRRKKLSKD